MQVPEQEHIHWVAQWYQEMLGGLALTFLGLYFKSKGKTSENVIIPISEDEIDHKMLICKQAILLAIHDELDKRDTRLFKHVERQNDKLIQRIKELK